MNRETTGLIWHNLSKQFKNKVDAYAQSCGAGSERLFIDVPICFAGTQIIGGLFVKRPIVDTATQSCHRQEMQ